MARPKKVDVGPYRYTVYFAEQLRDEEGFLDTSTRTIIVDGSKHAVSQKETLLHETLHAILDLTPLRSLDDDKQEELVSALSPYLFGVIRSNPTLLSFLTE